MHFERFLYYFMLLTCYQVSIFKAIFKPVNMLNGLKIKFSLIFAQIDEREKNLGQKN